MTKGTRRGTLKLQHHPDYQLWARNVRRQVLGYLEEEPKYSIWDAIDCERSVLMLTRASAREANYTWAVDQVNGMLVALSEFEIIARTNRRENA